MSANETDPFDPQSAEIKGDEPAAPTLEIVEEAPEEEIDFHSRKNDLIAWGGTLAVVVAGLSFSRNDVVAEAFRDGVREVAGHAAHFGSYLLHNMFDDLPRRP